MTNIVEIAKTSPERANIMDKKEAVEKLEQFLKEMEKTSDDLYDVRKESDEYRNRAMCAREHVIDDVYVKLTSMKIDGISEETLKEIWYTTRHPSYDVLSDGRYNRIIQYILNIKRYITEHK